MARTGEHALAGDDLEALDQALFQIFDASAKFILSGAEGLSTGFRFSIFDGRSPLKLPMPRLLTRWFTCVNLPAGIDIQYPLRYRL
jgi:hypothetical protein